MEIFLQELQHIEGDSGLLDFCRKRFLHGVPKMFYKNEDAYYEFRKRIAEKFNISFHEVYITGSAKLGFSPLKRKYFDYESDVDVAIISLKLFDRFMETIREYQMSLRESRRAVSYKELYMYHGFLEYTAIGWIRPDKLPFSFRVTELRDDWFEFFKSISYGNSEIGNYKISAGVFKTYDHFERYTYSGVILLKKLLDIEREENDKTV